MIFVYSNCKNRVEVIRFVTWYYFFQIRSLRAPNALVQTVILRDVQKLVQTDNCILAAMSNSVYGLLPVPIGAQVSICLVFKF
jgi:hypothetical protein